MDTQNENITKIDEKVEEVKEDKTESAQQEKLFHLPSLLIVIVFLSASFALSWYLGMKQAPGAENKKQQEQKEEVKKEENDKKENQDTPLIIDEIKLNIDDVRGKEFLEYFTYTLHNVYIDSSDHLIPEDKRTSENLFNDDITEFKFIYYLVERYGEKEYKKYNTNINGLHEVGAYAIKYNYFKEYYKTVMGKNFNDEVILKIGAPYQLNGEYLYGKVVSSLNANYRLSNESFSQIGEQYYYTVLVEELDANQQVILTYRVKLCVSIVNEQFMLNSIVVY